MEPDDAMHGMVKKITTVIGLPVGHSSGSVMVGALRVARRLRQGVIVVIFPDGGDRYLSHEI